MTPKQRKRGKNALTRQYANQYIKNGGVRCPFCGHDDLSGDSVEIDAGRAEQEVGCPSCNRQWTDVYVLTDIIPEQ